MAKGGTRVTVRKISGNGLTPLGHEIVFEIHGDGRRGLVTEPASAELLGQHARGRRQGDKFEVTSHLGTHIFHMKKVEEIPNKGKAETALPLAKGSEVAPELAR